MNLSNRISKVVNIDKTLVKFYLDQAKTLNTPMKKTFLLLNEGKEVTAAKRECYHVMIGSIIFSMVEIRSDIVYAILVVSYFAKNPSHLYSKAVKMILRYLKAKRDVEITYKRE